MSWGLRLIFTSSVVDLSQRMDLSFEGVNIVDFNIHLYDI